MGDNLNAMIFFGMTIEITEDQLILFEDRDDFKKYGNVSFDRINIGFEIYGDDPAVIGIIWIPSIVETEDSCDTTFKLPMIDENLVSIQIIKTCEKFGLKPEKPSWHLVASLS